MRAYFTHLLQSQVNCQLRGNLPPPPETTFQTYQSSINFEKPPDSLKGLRLIICPLFSTRKPSTYQYIKERPATYQGTSRNPNQDVTPAPINFEKPPDSLKALRLSICPLFSTRTLRLINISRNVPQPMKYRFTFNLYNNTVLFRTIGTHDILSK